VLVYVHKITPRLQYTLHFFSDYFKSSFEYTTNVDDFKVSTAARVNYSAQPLTGDEVWIKPVKLLFENGISFVTIDTFQHNHNYPAFFKTEGATGFDLFAAVFYLISRYEEYLPHSKDIYGRYAHESSLAYQQGFLHLPLINIWLQKFSALLLKSDSRLLKPHPFNFLPTYDIDMAWSYRNKGVMRNIGGLLKSLMMGQWFSVKDRVTVLRNEKKDPYDAYDWMDDLHKQYQLKPIYFIHAGQKRNRYDKNISTQNEEFRALIKSIARNHKTGLHPSWLSGNEKNALEKEKTELENIIGQNIYSSRQHFIRFTLPETYRSLINAGIREDYSMGYGSINGFRASVALPFYWYDLPNEVATELLIFPFCFMDANSFYEQKNTPSKALEELLDYYRILKQTGGLFISIWHNPFFGTDPLFKGWREVYEKFIATVSSNQKFI
jgi:hypothetical protein